MRLNKYLAERLGISRREADEAIDTGLVTVDGKVARLGQQIDVLENDVDSGSGLDKMPEVCYNGIIVPASVGKVLIAFNKPVGYVCSRKAQGDAPTIYEILPEEYRTLKTVGRLDKDSSGLILLTNDGDLAFEMTHPKFHKEKVYEVELDRALEPLHQQMIADFGIDLADGKSRLGLERMDDTRKAWKVTMSEGRNRQIRRTFQAVGYNVVKLHRTQFGKYVLDGLDPGAVIAL